MQSLLAAAEGEYYLSLQRSIGKITLDYGFTDRSHLDRYFTKLTKISPNKDRDRLIMSLFNLEGREIIRLLEFLDMAVI